jgi:hypothetical protein
MNQYQIKLEAVSEQKLRSALRQVYKKIMDLNYSKGEGDGYSYEFVNVTGSVESLDLIGAEYELKPATTLEIIGGRECLIIQSKLNYEESNGNRIPDKLYDHIGTGIQD